MHSAMLLMSCLPILMHRCILTWATIDASMHGEKTHRPAAVDTWLRSPALDGLQELEFWYNRSSMCRQELQPVPASAFRFSSRFRVAIISQCIIPDSTAQTIHFPQLKKLSLEQVTISEDSIDRVIAGCLVLESLLLNRYSGFDCIRINSPTLRSVAISSGKLVIEDAPSLQRLIHLDLSRGLRVTVISAPKLETLGRLSYQCTTIAFGSTILEGSRVDCLTTVVHSVKVLSIFIYTLSLDMVIDLMKLFPCLEKLYIETLDSGEKNLWRRKHQSFIRCHQIRLKTIVLAHYRGIKSHINFAMFFVLNAPMLELMRFEVDFGQCSKRFIAWQHKVLQLKDRASRDAQFYFTNDSCLHDLTNNRHTPDLSIADPFECRC
uniref:Uncharacterized protein n=1 Tax=Leersia perrieri TaxID=77586 RepID=A0A0D9WXM5_9ORYZ